MIKKMLSALALTLAVGFAAPAVVHAAPMSPVMIAKSSSTMSATGSKKLDKVLKTSNNTKRGKLDINTASAKELAALPGIGAITAIKIIKGRPYAGKDDLLKRKIVNAGVYAGIKDNIVAAQGGTKAATKAAAKSSMMKKKK